MRKQGEISTSFSDRDSLDGRESYYLVGIGGAGMSALARMFHHRGLSVRGADSTESVETGRLRSDGIAVTIGHRADGIEARDALVVSDAIDLEVSPEYQRAIELGIPVVRRSQALAWMLKGYRVIAVTGTHGKTTTTGMLGAGLIEAGEEPLVVVGANIPQFGGPVWEGNGAWAIVEACEAYDSFHDLDPQIVLLTNLELDHVDFHGNYENLRNSVLRFVAKLPEDGCLVYCSGDEGACEIAKMSSCRSFGYAAADFARLSAKDSGDVVTMPVQRGQHNLSNAAGALSVSELIGTSVSAAAKGIAGFAGAERRQQIVWADPSGMGFTVIDDYGHHPTEVRESLRAIRDAYITGTLPRRRLIVVFQPHLYSRTQDFIDEFADALNIADEVVLTDIYPAREAPIAGISSARIAEKVKKPVHYIPSRHLLPMKVAGMMRAGDVVVGMGAGNISEFAPALVKELGRVYDLDRTREAASPVRSTRPLQIVVIYGGDSAEREVSIHSGREIHSALLRLGHQSRLVDMTEVFFRGADLGRFVGPERPDLAFLAVHGTHAEDGAIQGLLELLHIPYTGSGIQASAIAMDKALTKQILAQHGIRVPKGALLHEPEPPYDITPPLIVKPNAQGSTVGLTFVETNSQICPALANAFAYDDSVLVEEWIQGIEISTPVLNGQALLPVEIAPISGRYDFESKYTPGATIEIVPARLSDKLLEESRSLAVKAHNALRCSGATRTDMIVRGDEIFVLEVNTLPGMTRTSLLPNSAAGMGIAFDQLCQMLVEEALGPEKTQF